jgi:hypothetical protein
MDDILEDVGQISNAQLQDSLTIFKTLRRLSENYEAIGNEDSFEILGAKEFIAQSSAISNAPDNYHLDIVRSHDRSIFKEGLASAAKLVDAHPAITRKMHNEGDAVLQNGIYSFRFYEEGASTEHTFATEEILKSPKNREYFIETANKLEQEFDSRLKSSEPFRDLLERTKATEEEKVARSIEPVLPTEVRDLLFNSNSSVRQP